MDLLKPVAEVAAIAVGSVGIAIITGAAAYSLLIGAKHMLYHGHQTETIFREIRQRLGRGILLGLEFLIAADIMLSVTIDLSFERAGVLILIVLVRAFLSFTLEVELTGKWPWHQEPEKRTESAD